MMANIDGSWDCVVKSPLGDQKTVLTVTTDGNTFTGTNAGALGSMDVNGEVDGDTITWTMNGDVLTGTVGAGAFGSFPMSGTRKA
jgi:hypothetical protein